MATPMSTPRTILCLASFHKGHEFLLQAKAEGWKSADRFVVEWSTDGKTWKTAMVVKPTKDWARVEGTLPHYQIIVDREKGLDTLEVQVEVTPEFFSDTVGAMEGLQERLVHSIEDFDIYEQRGSTISR